jgi:MFS family permease
MVARPMRLFRESVRAYRDALRGFSHNARAFLAGLALQNLAFGALLTVFGIYVKSRGLSEGVLGGVEGAIAIASAAVCLLAPPVVATFGYRRLFVMGAFAYALSRFGMAAAPAALPLVGFGLVGGVGEGVMQSTTASFLAANSTPSERTHLFTLDLVVRVFAGFAGGVIGGLLPPALALVMPEARALQVTVAAAAVVLAVSAVPFFRMREHERHARHALAGWVRTMRSFRSWGHLGRLVAPQMTVSFGAGFVMPFVSLYLNHQLGASIATVGLIQGVAQVAMGVAALCAPLVARRFGLIRGTVLTQLTSLPLLVAIPFARSIALAAVLVWLRSAFMNMSWPLFNQYSMEVMNMSWPLFNQYSMEGVHDDEKPVVAAWLALGWAAGWLGGSVLGGRIMTVSYTLPYFCTAALYTLAVALTWLLFRGRDVRPGDMLPDTTREVA